MGTHGLHWPFIHSWPNKRGRVKRRQQWIQRYKTLAVGLSSRDRSFPFRDSSYFKNHTVQESPSCRVPIIHLLSFHTSPIILKSDQIKKICLFRFVNINQFIANKSSENSQDGLIFYHYYSRRLKTYIVNLELIRNSLTLLPTPYSRPTSDWGSAYEECVNNFKCKHRLYIILTSSVLD